MGLTAAGGGASRPAGRQADEDVAQLGSSAGQVVDVARG